MTLRCLSGERATAEHSERVVRHRQSRTQPSGLQRNVFNVTTKDPLRGIRQMVSVMLSES